jgi:hypothetical protein
MQTRNAGDGCNHHAREKLHGRDIAFVECAGRRRQHLKHAERSAIVAQGRNQNRANAETAAASQIHARIALGIMTQHDFAGAHGFGGNSGVSLQAYPEIGSGTAGSRAADNFVSGAQGDGRSGCPGEVLGTFSDSADRGFKIQFGGVNMNFFSHMHSAKSGSGVRGVRHAKLAAQSRGWYSSVMIGHIQNLRVGNGAEQVADEKVEFRISDEMSGLLLPQGATQDAGETEKGLISASQAVGSAVIANQFTLNAERG